ncbi:MAG: UbiA family prenyltransferase [Candidatus Micrarchaeota archaeon]|nr:UbiA family prenyltransferase [Candidatus Micrarchaeota archaeon]
MAYGRLFRIEHALMLAVAVLFGELVAADSFALPLPAPETILLSLAVPIFLEMASFALNDFLDIETDRENRRKDRPLVSGEISPRQALAASALCYAAGLAAAAPLPTLAFQLALVFALASILYSWKLKDMMLVGNLYIAASMAVPFVFGNIVVSSRLDAPVLAVAAGAFVSGLGREIVKSAEDLEGDVKRRKSRTLPAVVGKKNACFLAALLYFLLAPLSLLPFYFGLRANILSAGLVIVAAAAFFAIGISVARNQAGEGLESARKSSLLAAGVGLAGYWASLLQI